MADSGVEKWVVVELSHQGERKTAYELKTIVENEISDGTEVFIPSITYTRHDNNVTVCLMEGYFFVSGGLPSSIYFQLENLPYVRRVLSRDEATGRYICYVGESTVTDLKEKLRAQAARDIEVGDDVLVTDGTYSELKGEVLDLFPDEGTATLRIKELVSMDVIVKLPYQFFERVLETHENED